MKIAYIDIETAPSLGYVWQMWEADVLKIEKEWYIMSFAVKWDNDKTKCYALPDFKNYKKNPEDDSELVKKLWEVFNDADIVVGHNCVEVNTPILKQDLTWVKAGDLTMGDKIVGFEEKTPPGIPVRNSNGEWVGVNGKNRKILPAVVTDFSIKKSQCLKVTFNNGDSVITTKDHYWLGKAEKDENLRWYKSEKLRIGQRMVKYWNTWEQDTSYIGGWLSGFISGEGSLCQYGFGFAVDFYQRPGSTWNQALEYCEKLNMPVSDERTQRPTGIGRQDTQATGFLGGKFKIAENIGRLRINRFIEKINWEILTLVI